MNRKKLLKNLLFAQMKGHIFKYICIFLGRKCVLYRVIAHVENMKIGGRNILYISSL